MTSLPSVSDPLRSRAIYQVTDYSRIRSPVAKPTMAGLTTTEAVPFATAGIAGSPLMGLSPTPKPTMVRDLMPPPPPVLPQAGHKAVTPHKTLAVGRTLGPTNSEPPDRQASEEAGEHVAADDSPREAQGIQNETLALAHAHATPTSKLASMACSSGQHSTTNETVQTSNDNGASSTTPGQRSTKRPMILGGWYIKRLGVMSDGEVLVAVEGRREDPGHGTPGRRPWHSTAIRQRVDARTLKTASGSVYILNGPMNMHASPMSVFPASMKDAFSDGFPDNWMTYLRPGADGCAPALSQPMCTNNNSLDNHIEGALQSGAISAAATHPTAAGPSVPTPAAGSVPATDCIDEPNTRTSAADDELNVSSPNLVKSSTFNVSMSLQQAREGPNISANSEANAGAKAGHRGKSKETPEREKQTSSQGNADVPEGDTGNGANVTQNCASEAERADSVVLAGSQADTHDDIEIVVTQESDMSDEVLDGTICPSAAGMETEEGGEHASPSSSQTSKNLRHTDAPAAANSTVQVPALKDAHVRSKMCARRAVSPAPKRADARKQVSVDADRALVAKRASSAGASASKMTSRGGAKTPRSVPIPSHTSKTNDEAGASSSIGASRRKAGASSSEAKARSKRSTPDATREASYHAPVRRLSSGRVTIKPLAFWANEVVARTSDGAFIADGQNLKMKQFSNVIDLTASFASKITAPSSSNSELRKVRGASSGDLLEPRSDSSHDEVRRARGSSSSQRPPLPSNDKISIQRRTSAHSATDASRASTDVLQAEYSASGSCHANLGEYVVLKDEKVYDIARALQLDPQEVVRLNSSRLRSIRVSSRLKEGTRLLVPMTALGICSPDVGAGTSGTANFERQNLGEDEVQRDAEAASLQPPRGKRRSADLSLSVGDEVRILSQHEECGKLGRVVDPACGRGWVRVEISGAFYHFRAKQLGPVAALPKGHNSRDGDLDHDAPADENGPEPSIPPGRSMRVRLPPDRFQVSPPKEKRARDKVATISSSMASGDEKPSAPIHARECESADDSNDLAIGTVVHVIKEDSRRGCVGEVQAISNGWIRVRMDDSSASFRRCDLCVVGNRTNIQERGKAPLAGREGTSVQSTELLGASEPLATGNHGKEWSKSNIDKLKAAHFRTAPDVDDFWGHVAKLVPGYNAEECSNQYYLMYPTPSRNKRKRAATPIQAGRASTEATSHPDLLPASPWRGESRRGDDGEDDEDDGGVLRNFSSIDRSQIGEYAQKVRQKRLKGRETAAVRARKTARKGRATATSSSKTSRLKPTQNDSAASTGPCAHTDEDEEEDEESEDADNYFDSASE